MNRLEAPFDRWAEETVVGCAIATPRGAELAAGRLSAADFYNPKHGRLFAAALALQCSDLEERIAEVASETGVDRSEIARLVDDRAVSRDSSGGFAARVLDASQRRQVMAAAADVYNAVGTGARLEEIRPLLRVIGIGA